MIACRDCKHYHPKMDILAGNQTEILTHGVCTHRWSKNYPNHNVREIDGCGSFCPEDPVDIFNPPRPITGKVSGAEIVGDTIRVTLDISRHADIQVTMGAVWKIFL